MSIRLRCIASVIPNPHPDSTSNADTRTEKDTNTEIRASFFSSVEPLQRIVQCAAGEALRLSAVAYCARAEATREKKRLLEFQEAVLEHESENNTQKEKESRVERLLAERENGPERVTVLGSEESAIMTPTSSLNHISNTGVQGNVAELIAFSESVPELLERVRVRFETLEKDDSLELDNSSSNIDGQRKRRGSNDDGDNVEQDSSCTSVWKAFGTIDIDAPDDIAVHSAERLGDTGFVSSILVQFKGVELTGATVPAAETTQVTTSESIIAVTTDGPARSTATQAWTLSLDAPLQVTVPRQVRLRVERREKRHEQRERRQLRALQEAGPGRASIPPAVHTEFAQLRAKFGATFWELIPAAHDLLAGLQQPTAAWSAVQPSSGKTDSSGTTSGQQQGDSASTVTEGNPEHGYKLLPRFLPARARILFVPSDPEFPFDLDAVDLRVTFPVGYPGGAHPCGVVDEEHPLFEVANNPNDLPPKFCRVIAQGLAERVSTAYAKRGQKNARPYMLNLLRWLDNRVESMLVDKRDTTVFQAQQLGVELVGVPNPPRLPEVENGTESNLSGRGKQEQDGDGANADRDDDGYEVPAWLASQMEQMGRRPITKTCSSSDDASGNAEEEGPNEDADSDVEPDGSQDNTDIKSARAKANAAFATTTAHRGIQFVIEDILLRNVGIMECTMLAIVVVCGRCRVQDELRLPAVGQNGVPADGFAPYACHNCHDERTLAFRPEQMHEMSKIIGYVDVEPVGAVSILEVLDTSIYSITCLECGEVSEGARGIPLGTNRTWQRRCHGCHGAMDIQFGKVAQRRIRIERSREDLARIQERIAAAAARKKEQRDLLVKDPWMCEIRVGNPLPDHGTCRHYKRSKRWLRFPCCRRVFPCDICHNEATLPENFHPMVLATRMLCGFCSFEQPFRIDGICDNCGKTLGVSHSNHWEGGGGQRDSRRLSKGDSRKSAGKNKTQSQKSKRVGQVGKDRRDRGAARGGGRGGASRGGGASRDGQSGHTND